MSDDELRALINSLCDASDNPEAAFALRAAIFVALDRDKNRELTPAERAECAAIDAWLDRLESQKENADWQTSETKTGNPGLTH